MTKHDIYVPIESPGDLRILHALLKEAGEPVNALDAYAMDNFGKYESGVDINTLNVHNLSFWNGRWILTSVKGKKKITLDELRSLLLPDSKYVGKWLKDPVGPNLMYITSEESNECLYGYGLNSEGVWSDYSTRGLGTCAFNFFAKRLAREATYLEVKDALIGQAKKRGFDKESFSIKDTVHPIHKDLSAKGGSFRLTSDGKTLYYGGVVLFHEGKWAELKEEVKFSELKREMKTFTEHMQDRVGAEYPLETILYNLSPEEIEEEAHNYAKEVAREALRNAIRHFDEKTSLGLINIITSESNIPEL